MKARTEYFPAKNPNPVLSVGKDGTFLYSNESGEPLLHEWGVETGERLPPSIVDTVRRVISRSSPEKMEVKVGKRVYLVVFSPVPEQECVNISGFDISDQKEHQEKLLESEEKYIAIFENSIDAVLHTTPDGTIQAANPAACQMFRMTEDEIIQAGRDGISDISDPRLRPALEERVRTGKFKGELNYRRKDGSIFPGEVSSAFFKDKSGIVRTAIIIRDITERKRLEREREMSIAFLQLMNESRGTTDLIHSVVSFFRERFDFEAIGIRLKDGDDYPYFETSGFPEKFVKLENSLCTRDNIGKPVHDSAGNPILECMCGNVICGRFDPSMPFFTIRGSFWTNSTTELLAATTEADRQNRTRNRCNGEGYESVALIALRLGEERFGLLQLNDKQKGKFSLEMIAMLERLADYLAVAIARKLTEETLCETFEILQEQSEELKMKNKELKAQSEELQLLNEELEAKSRELSKVNEELRKSESKYRHIIETSREGIWLIDRNGRTTYVNQRVPEMLGYSIDEILGQSPQKFLAPESRAIADDRLREHRQRVNQVIDYQFIRKDGSTLWCILSSHQMFDNEGKYAGSIGMLTDITERKRAEEALQKLHDNLENLVEERTSQLEQAYKSLKESEEGLAEAQRMAHTGNWRWDILTDELFWSDEVYRIFGLNPQEVRITYDLVINCIHPEDRDYVINAINEGLNGNPVAVEYRIILPDGEERIVHTECKIITYDENNPIQAKGTVQDITERKRAEEALANIEIARKKEIHHRIKNNLQVISSLLDLQADKFDDPKVIEAFRESQNRVVSMALIHEELYKGEGTDTLNFSTYIRELAGNLFQTYSLNSKNIRLCMDMEENAFFNMDTAVPLGIIVNELVLNSFKHAFPGRDRGEIGIKLFREKNGKYKKEIDKATSFVMSVSDNGVGIPKDLDIEDLDSLGIQLVTTLVDQLDGELELKRNNGTEFTIKFTVVERK